ncbi:MAG: hypothetical protein ACRD21_07480, partial [Vicinamibacteria bacterium]
MSSRVDRRSFLQATALGLSALPAASSRSFGALDEDPLGVRSEFPVTIDEAYLNTAYVGPIPKRVREAELEYADEKMLRPARARRSDRADRARSRFAELFGAKKEEIALLYS